MVKRFQLIRTEVALGSVKRASDDVVNEANVSFSTEEMEKPIFPLEQDRIAPAITYQYNVCLTLL